MIMLKELLILLLSPFYFDKYGMSNVEALSGPRVEEIRENRFPFSVAFINIEVDGDRLDQYFCGGTLITRKHVLTGSHCMEGEIIANLRVLAGSHDLLSPEMIAYEVLNYVTYRFWAKYMNRATSDTDRALAIITLLEEIRNPQVIPISLSNVHAFRLTGQAVAIAGWGDGDGNIMTKVNMEILRMDKCLENPSAFRDSFLLQIAHRRVVCAAPDPSVLGSYEHLGIPMFDIRKQLLVGIYYMSVRRSLDDDWSLNYVFTVDLIRDFIRDVVESPYHSA